MPVDDAPGITANEPLGDVWAGHCYMVKLQGGLWNYDWLVEDSSKEHFAEFKNGDHSYLPAAYANAEEYEFLIHGRKFKYNEAGEVYDQTLGLVGHLYCTHVMNVCAGFAKKSR